MSLTLKNESRIIFIRIQYGTREITLVDLNRGSGRDDSRSGFWQWLTKMADGEKEEFLVESEDNEAKQQERNENLKSTIKETTARRKVLVWFCLHLINIVRYAKPCPQMM